MVVKLSQHLEFTDWSLSAPTGVLKLIYQKQRFNSIEIAGTWPHLRKIKEKISLLNESLNVGVLIGSNCPNAIKPREIVAGKSEDPYAVQTLLGWCIVGPANP